jgi:hydrogenase nickel incorporation protein HypA/HybF
MHELSIALRILDIAAEVAGQHEGRVVAVRVKLGPLSGVQKDALGWAFDLAKEETLLAAAELVIDETSLSAYCPACSAVRTLQSDYELCCPVCGGPTPEIKTGRELEVVALEIDA